MRPDTTFSDKKLTRKEFGKKYWLDGDALDQYHTTEIEDGRDEREQLIINNIRALFKMNRENFKRLEEVQRQANREVNANSKKRFFLAILLELIMTIYILERKR